MHRLLPRIIVAALAAASACLSHAQVNYSGGVYVQNFNTLAGTTDRRGRQRPPLVSFAVVDRIAPAARTCDVLRVFGFAVRRLRLEGRCWTREAANHRP